jgi:YggT family protein
VFVLANLLSAVARVLDVGLNIYAWALIARALISWVNPDPYNPIVRFLNQVTEPVLGRIRRAVPYLGGIDVSPVIAVLAVYFIRWFLVATIADVALRLKTGGGI